MTRTEHSIQHSWNKKKCLKYLYEVDTVLKEEIKKADKNCRNSINLLKKDKKTFKKLTGTNKTVQDLKVYIEIIKKTQIERILGMENLGKWTTDTSIDTRIQEMGEEISGIEDTK